MNRLLCDAFDHELSPVETWCLQHLSSQFQYMSSVQIWDVIAKIQNRNVPEKCLKKRKRQEANLDHLFCSETIHTCDECGGHDIINNQVQVRGADESMTQFLFCQTCGAMWKEE